ncbi:MAG: class I SAM-dependent methyltransferase [Terriglobales bacterium]
MVRVAERAVVTDAGQGADHLEDFTRYRFACNFVSGKKVLDVACGSGYGSALLFQEGGATCVMGVDASWEALKAARRFLAPGSVEFVLSDAGQLPFCDGGFDVIVSMETLEHLYHPEAFLRELGRLLCAGGTAIISTPLNNSETRLQPVNPYHCREYSAGEFLDLLHCVFREAEVFSQLSEYDYDPLWAPLERVRSRSWARQMAASCLPPALRRGLRNAMGSKGRQLAASRIIPGYNDGAAYQVAVCSQTR